MRVSNLTWNRSSRLSEIIAAFFILLFVYTAISKLGDLQQFEAVLRSSPLIGQKASWLSVVLPVTELVVAMALFFPRSRQTGFWASLVLMMLFTLYISYMMLFAPHLPCSCGGVIQKLSWKQHLGLNVALTLLTALAVFQHKFFGMVRKKNSCRRNILIF